MSAGALRIGNDELTKLLELSQHAKDWAGFLGEAYNANTLPLFMRVKGSRLKSADVEKQAEAVEAIRKDLKVDAKWKTSSLGQLGEEAIDADLMRLAASGRERLPKCSKRLHAAAALEMQETFEKRRLSLWHEEGGPGKHGGLWGGA